MEVDSFHLPIESEATESIMLEAAMSVLLATLASPAANCGNNALIPIFQYYSFTPFRTKSFIG